jgi:class 3 adenylate cyclase
MTAAQTQYTRSGDVHIAYQVVGDGPFDVIVTPGRDSHVEFGWQVPLYRTIYESLASFSRLIVFDKRGTGMSDHVTNGVNLDTRMDDCRAVMDAVGSERAAVCGFSEGASTSILFAATYPERVWALTLYGARARVLRAHDYPWGLNEAEYRRMVSDLKNRWSEPGFLEEVSRQGSPSADDEEIRALAANIRYGLSPGAADALMLTNMEIDVRHVLPAIHMPTLVLHRATDTWVPIEHARYIAARIPGAAFVEVPGEGHVGSAAEAAPLIGEIGRFLQRVWEAGVPVEAEPERVLATVLFTDIVGSSERAVELGDRAWSELLGRHHELVRRQLVRFRGVEVDTAGDGFFASFDGPARAIRCACAISDSMVELGLGVRVGLHTGECELINGKIAGIAVHTGARVASLAQPGEVLVSSTVKDLVAGSGIAFRDCGRARLRGIPGEWWLFAVVGSDKTS